MEKTAHWIGQGILLLGCCLCAPPVVQMASAQAPPASARQKTEAAAYRQAAAVAAMASSIDRQTGSIRRQLSSSPATGFFLLPPPERLSGGAFLPPDCDALPPAEIDSLVNVAARREGVAPELIRGVMKQESAFRPCAVSSKGAEGLMQLMPQTAATLEVEDPFNPRDNVTAGTKLLRQLLQHYDGDLALTLGAYNAGPRRVDADMAIPGIPETANYVQRILSLLPLEQMRSLSFDSGDSGLDH